MSEQTPTPAPTFRTIADPTHGIFMIVAQADKRWPGCRFVITGLYLSGASAPLITIGSLN